VECFGIALEVYLLFMEERPYEIRELAENRDPWASPVRQDIS
jgi:hypothetical protein